ncbi:MAG: hypothetical protein NVSMB32_04310 [Actinomycetota bacterium]
MLAEGEIELVDCPECGLAAYVEHRFAVRSTEGPVPHAVTLCPRMHRLCTPEVGSGTVAATEDQQPALAPQGPWDDTDGSATATP